MNDPLNIRKKVRLILSALPVNRRWATDIFLLDQLNDGRFFAEKVKVDELAQALKWNEESGYISFRHNRDDERLEWFLTASGLHKEGIA